MVWSIALRGRGLPMLAEKGWEAVSSFFFPPRCVGCGEFESFLCEECCQRLIPVRGACSRCGNPGFSDGPEGTCPGRCAECNGWEQGFAAAASAFRYEGVAVELVTALKYRGERVLARTMMDCAAEAFAGFLRRVPGGCEGMVVLTWVPAFPRSERERGYNQGELLCRALPRSLEVQLPVHQLAIKGVETRSQRELGAEERRSNLAGAFAASPDAPAVIENIGENARAVILVDDVYTTGATAHEVSRVLRDELGLPIYAFAFSRTPGPEPVGGVAEWDGNRTREPAGPSPRSAIDVVSFAVR